MNAGEAHTVHGWGDVTVGKSVGAQSAIEFITDYGWAMLLIGVAIAAFYSIGALSPTTPGECLAVTGYLCQNPTLFTSGALSVEAGQISSGPITLTGTACTKSSMITGIQSVESVTLEPDQQQSIIFRCPLSDNSIGSRFSGYLWVQYTSQSGQQGVIQELGRVRASVTNANPSLYAPVAFVDVRNSGIYVLNLGTDTLSGTIQGGSLNLPLSSIVSPNNQYLYVGTTYWTGTMYNGGLYTISLSNDMVVNVINGFAGVPGAFAFSPDGGSLYLSDGAGNFIAVNLGSHTIYKMIGGQSITDMAMSSNGVYAYIATGGGGTVNTINIGTGITVNTISGFRDPTGITLSQNGQYAWVSDTGDDELSEVNLGTGAIVMIIGCLNPSSPIILSSDGTDAYYAGGSAACPQYANRLVEINLNSGAITVKSAAQPFGLPGLQISPDEQNAYFYEGYSQGGFITMNISTGTVSNIVTGFGSEEGFAVYTPTSP